MQNPELAEVDSRAMQRVVILSVAVAALAVIPPAWIERLPSVCLNRLIFGFCPACGSLRALVCLFHGALGQALKYNPNCLLTGPLLLILLLSNLRHLARSSDSQTRSCSIPSGSLSALVDPRSHEDRQ